MELLRHIRTTDFQEKMHPVQAFMRTAPSPCQEMSKGKFKGTSQILHGILNSIPTCVEGCQKMAASTNSGSSEQKRKASQSKLSSFFTLEKRYKSVSNLDEEVQPRETTQARSVNIHRFQTPKIRV